MFQKFWLGFIGILLIGVGGIAWGNDVSKGVVLTSLNLRAAPNLAAKVITVLKRGTMVSVLAGDERWMQVKLDDYREGWAAKAYISTEPALLNSRDRFDSRSGALISYARQFLGVGYHWGGNSPRGFDCSGFTMYVYSQFGYKLPHNAAAQMELGTPVNWNELLPGDLVFFATYGGNYINHVGLYIGGDRFMHASTYNGMICTNVLSDAYYTQRYRGARRYIELPLPYSGE